MYQKIWPGPPFLPLIRKKPKRTAVFPHETAPNFCNTIAIYALLWKISNVNYMFFFPNLPSFLGKPKNTLDEKGRAG